MKRNIVLVFIVSILIGCNIPKKNNVVQNNLVNGNLEEQEKKYNVMKTEEEWQKLLNKEQYDVLRNKGTERAFTGEYVNNHENGNYNCAACDQLLFHSDTKFESGSGWPSFYAEAAGSNVVTKTDKSLGMSRTEILCGNCGGHLGHLFDDGPNPTGMRYCVNSVSLKFAKENK